MVGTGVFVSLGLCAGVAGPGALIALALAAGVATCNGLSSAQLAASHPVSGGTYEYGYRYLTPSAGFTAGVMFLAAKSASAATAALGAAGYLLDALGRESDRIERTGLALVLVVLATAVVRGGIRRTNLVNVIVVGVTLAALGWFVALGLPRVEAGHFSPLIPEQQGLARLAHATALAFVAYTGYGRIATLGEEVREPARTIPRAIVLTMALTLLVYGAVAATGVGLLGAEGFARATDEGAAPLATAAEQAGLPYGAWVLGAGAVTAMVGVLLNLVLGLSRVVLAMARRGDAPPALASLGPSGDNPAAAAVAAGVVVAVLTLVGDVRATWSFSAFTVLVYYSLTNLAALRLPDEGRLFPRWVSGLGLAACATLAFQVERGFWSLGLAALAAALVWHAVARRARAGGG